MDMEVASRRFLHEQAALRLRPGKQRNCLPALLVLTRQGLLSIGRRCIMRMELLCAAVLVCGAEVASAQYYPSPNYYNPYPQRYAPTPYGYYPYSPYGYQQRAPYTYYYPAYNAAPAMVARPVP